jgi:NTE family protein
MNNENANTSTNSKTGLVLTGGGARAAFQVGALRAISDIVLRHQPGNPFPIITGVSAGAINATVLAAYAMHPRVGIRTLEKVWGNFSVDQVFRSDFLGVAKHSGRWFRALFSNDYHRKHSISLLNNQPLKALLGRVMKYHNIQKAIDAGQLEALSVTASGYNSGESISFFQANKSMKNWRRHRRCGARTEINREHLLASSAIPMIFPAVKINREYFGDGSVRLLSPISPAIHLGADKILIIGVHPEKESIPQHQRPKNIHPPSAAEIASHVLDSVFVDSLQGDIERVERVNQTIKLIPEPVLEEKSKLRPIETFAISPSEDFTQLASKHFKELPRLIRFLFARVGIGSDEGSTALSYLLFQSSYTKELIDLGYTDTMRKKEAIKQFFNVV